MTRTEKNSEFEFIEGLTAELSSKELIFPTSLNATMKIRRALSHPDMSTDTVVRIISTEPVLSAQILRMSNSAMYNHSSKKIVDLRAATLLLGFTTIRNIAISVGMKQLADHKADEPLSRQLDGLWTRSLRVAALSYVIARHLSNSSPDKAMLAGLLHDVGKFYILNRARHYQGLFVSNTALWEVIDQWHAEIGVAILENWDIDEDILAAVMDHRTSQLPHTNRPGLTDVVATADFLDGHFVAASLDEINWQALPTALENLQLDFEKCQILMAETKAELGLILRALS
ncbi:HDOD domain-containing protein [Undibacterium sp. Jales W-56]|uniref:HDOD domain-containing protein n=1 Tax=Undibacterium sp. Jales W-56 TaxID=2897325 RepID=UPI0021D33142|nr:HDOD domain-containing protein [Undibacterium sp. Jales W-56]MCU6432846.1 HDOD domain-containing protein [Undibacterium sp. Jales W-56]